MENLWRVMKSHRKSIESRRVLESWKVYGESSRLMESQSMESLWRFSEEPVEACKDYLYKEFYMGLSLHSPWALI